MVSALWKACSEGNLDAVHDLLREATTVDIEIRDHTGSTPLIEAVKNGHVDVVRALLDKGADPNSASSQGRPDQYTSDPAILELLHYAQGQAAPSGMPSHDSAYGADANGEPPKPYYPPPPGAYAYYPGMPQGPPIPEGAVAYYPPPPPPPSGEQQPSGPGNLPPPEIARFIPCRYYPACRYGAACMFLHPQASYYPGSPPPPAQYPSPYDAQGYSPNYYGMPPHSFPPQPTNGQPAMSPPAGPTHHSPHPSMGHTQNGSEIVSPIQGAYASPAGPPPAPYGPMAPTSPTYAHHAPVPAPMPMQPHASQPPQPQMAPAPQQSPQAMYHNVPQHNAPNQAPPFAVRPDAAHYAPPPQNGYAEAHPGMKSPPLQPQPEGFNPGPGYRGEGGPGHHRRGSMRRGPLGPNRKPPCLFFPSGRCRNGDDCRFPHVLPDESGNTPFTVRQPPRSRAHPGSGPGFGALEDRFANMSVRDDGTSHTQNGAEGSSRSHSTEAGSRSASRFAHGFKTMGSGVGVRGDKKAFVKQRVPNADEFPVLAGSTTPPLRSPGINGSRSNGHAGPTAAQILRAPPPARRDSGSVGGSAESGQHSPSGKAATELNGHQPEADSANKVIPLTFATIATAAPDASNQVSVSA